MTLSLAHAILAVSASIDASIVVKATLVMAATLLGLRYAARDARASVRHAILVATFGMLLVLPLAAMLMPRFVVGIPVAQAVGDTGAPLPTSLAPHAASTVGVAGAPGVAGVTVAHQAPAVARHTQWPSASTLFRAAWVMGTLLFLLPLAVPLWRLRNVRRRGRPWVEGAELVQRLAVRAGIQQTIDVLLHDDVVVPVTYGVARPVILLPVDAAGWNAAEIEQAIVHEVEHVRRHDWPTMLLARVACAMYWFHPLAWIGLRALALESERACDDAVVREADHAAYADQLLRLAERLSNGIAHPVLSMANRSQLAVRIAAILNRDQRRGRPNLIFATTIAVAGFAVVLAIAPLAAVARVPDSPARGMKIELPATAGAPPPFAKPATVTIAPAVQIPQVIQISRALAPLTPIVQIPAAPQPAPAPVAQPAPADSSSQATDGYVIRPNDFLSIAVFDDRGAEQNSKYRVDESGMVTLPFVGRMQAAGKRIVQFQDDLAKRLTAGRLTVVTAPNPPVFGVYVTGAVPTPGVIRTNGTLTLMAALVQAGSPQSDAGDEVQISSGLRPMGAGAQALTPTQADRDVVHVKLRDLNLGAGNVVLQDGDVVFVPPARHYTITGQVRNSGTFVWTSGVTVEQAIARAGGLSDRGSTRGVRARRLVDGKPAIVDLTTQDEIQADDIVTIASRIF